VIVYSDGDFVDGVRLAAGTERPLDVVYDGVGRTTFHAGLGLLRPRGTMVLFGQASGPVEPFDLQDLNANGSLYVTRPSLGHHMGDEGPGRAAEVFGWIADGDLTVRIDSRYRLEDAADAHRALEGRRTTGKVLIVAGR
jgi:NADPH2:quinone reductase